LPLLDFLRDIGKHVTVNQMVAKESVRNRMAGDEGISFTEFTYMLLQAQDFLWLYENEGCEMQIGGSDQWGNISLGVDLIRRRTGQKAHALTWPLLLQADGSKYGKTAGGETVWLNADRMSPYRFYQAWIQSEDDELSKLFRWLTFLSIDEIDDVVASHGEAPHLRAGQKRLARELTAIVHGQDATAGAEQATDVLFGGGQVDGLPEATFEILSAEIETTALSRDLLDAEDNLVPVLVKAGVTASNSEANRLLKQDGVSVNGSKVGSATAVGRSDLQHDRYMLIRKGKKSVHLVDFGAD
jgi:tyrosyl-tRNA synthetase